MSNTKGKRIGILDYIALYQMSLRSYFWRVDGRQMMKAMNNGDAVTPVTITTPIWFISIFLSYGLPVILIFGVVSFVQAILLTPLRLIIPAMRMNLAMHPASYISMIFMGAFLMLICSPIIFNKERLKYNLHFKKSAWWENTGITPRQIIKDRGLYGEYIATMAAELNMKKHGLYGRVFNNVVIPKEDGNFNEADVVCVNTAGIQVIEAKYRGGSFIGGLTSETWTQKIGNQVNEDMENPLYQNNGHVNCLINYLFDHMPNGSARTKASFVYSYVNVALLTNMECDTSMLDGTVTPASFFLGPAEGNQGYINLNLREMYKRTFSKNEVNEICEELEKISGYTHAYVQNLVQKRKQDRERGVYRYKYFYSVVRLESATSDGQTSLADFICREDYSWRNYDWNDNDLTNKTCMFRYYMDPSDQMWKAVPNSRMLAQSAKTTDFNEIQNYYNRIMND